MIPESARRLPQQPEKAVLPQDALQIGKSVVAITAVAALRAAGSPTGC
jgi:hypothetical protein